LPESAAAWIDVAVVKVLQHVFSLLCEMPKPYSFFLCNGERRGRGGKGRLTRKKKLFTSLQVWQILIRSHIFSRGAGENSKIFAFLADHSEKTGGCF
jgi:hypothetical protein